MGRRILARNFRTAFGEIDIVVLDGETIEFVEVRSRTSGGLVSPLESVDAAKQRRLTLTAEAFLQRRGLADRPVRFTLASVVGERIDLIPFG